MSDPGGRFATPLDVLEIRSSDHAIDLIEQVIRREGVERLVVGLPINMDGTMGEQARRAIEWARALEKRVNISAMFVDERLSSFAAEQSLADRKRAGERLTRKRKKESLDALAAAGFLQEYLDGRLLAIELPPE